MLRAKVPPSPPLRWLVSLWAFSLCASLLPSKHLQAQMLEDALVSTYLANPTLEAERAALRAATDAVGEAQSGWRPTLAIEGELFANDVDESGASDSFVSKSAALVLEQNIYQGGETVASVGRAEQLLLYRRARLAVVEQQVLLSAIEAYAGLANARAVLELARQNEKRLARQLDATGKRLKAGELTGTDAAQAEARHAGAIATRALAESAVHAAEAVYGSVTGEAPAALASLAMPDLAVTAEVEAKRLALDNNPAIRAARYRLAAAESDIRIAEAAVYPSLDLKAELGYEDDPSLDVSYERAATVGLELRIPLYQGGGEYARIRRARQETSQVKDDLEAVKRAVTVEVVQAWQDFSAANRTMASLERQVEAAGRALTGAEKEAAVGQRTVLDLLDLEGDLFQAEIDRANAARDEVVASYRLRLVLGDLTADSLDLPGERYDAERYDRDNRGRLIGVGG